MRFLRVTVFVLGVACAAPSAKPGDEPSAAPDAAARTDVKAAATPKTDGAGASPADAAAPRPQDTGVDTGAPDAAAPVAANDAAKPPEEPGADGLPKPWKAMDVGKVPTKGETTYANGRFTVEGAGYELWHHIDFFHTAYREVAGDAVLVAQVTSVEKVTNGSAAGLIARFDPKGDRGSVFTDPAYDPHLHPEARNRSDFQAYVDDVLGKQPLSPGVMIFWSNGNVVYAHRWQTLGAVGGWGPGPQVTQVTNVALPVWLKIERAGNKFTASYATDGVTWKTIAGREPSYTEEIFNPKRQGDAASVKPTDPYALGLFYLPKLAGTKTGKATFEAVTLSGGAAH